MLRHASFEELGVLAELNVLGHHARYSERRMKGIKNHVYGDGFLRKGCDQCSKILNNQESFLIENQNDNESE